MVARRFIVPGILLLAAGAGLAAGLVLQERSVGLDRNGSGKGPAARSGARIAGPPDFVLDLGGLPAGAVPGAEVAGRLQARDRRLGDPIPGMRLRWTVMAAAVEIARGEGLTGADGLLAVRFRAKVAGTGREPRIWAADLEFRAAGLDDLGRPVEASRGIALAAPGAPLSRAALQSPAAGLRAILPVPGLMRVGDRATLRGTIVNGTLAAQEVAGLLDASGVEVEGALMRRVILAPGGSTPVEWPVAARASGQARAWLTARAPATASHGGGTWKIGPVGRQVGQAWVGGLDGPASLTVAIPPEAQPDTVALAVTVARSAGGAAVAAAHALVGQPADGPDGLAATLLAASAALSARPEARIAQDLRSAARKALGELAAVQNPDGGWGRGWMPGGASRLETTAFALRALESGKAAGRSLERAARFIQELEPQEPEDAALALWALGPRASVALRDRAWGKVRRMGSAGLARTTAGLARAGDSRSLAALTLLDQRVREEAGLAHWQSGLADAPGSGGGDPDVAATALAISARLALDPRDGLAPPAIRWLLRSRHGERWASDRSTALAIQALADGEAANPAGAGAAGRVSVLLDGRERGRLVGHGGVPARMVLTAADLPAGTHILDLRPAGAPDGPGLAQEAPSFTATLRYLVPERPATPPPDAELRIRREYFAAPAARLARAGGATVQDLVSGKRPLALAAGGRIPLGGALVVRLTLVTRRDLASVRVTDSIPAGTVPIVLPALPALPAYHRGMSEGEVRILAGPVGRGQHVFFHALRPRIAGSFGVPGPVAEAGDAPGSRARGVASRLELVR